jgi:hypothetical protein
VPLSAAAEPSCPPGGHTMEHNGERRPALASSNRKPAA